MAAQALAKLTRYRRRSEGSMTSIITVDEIGQCRGPDNNIDLKAVFGGRMSARRQKGLKVNPIYSDGNHSSSSSMETEHDINGNMSNAQIVTYETFPKKVKGKMKHTLSDPERKVENGFIVNNKNIVAPSGEDSESTSYTTVTDSSNENTVSPYTLLPPGTDQSVPNEKLQNHTDVVLAKNQRNSKPLEYYKLLPGGDGNNHVDGDIQKIPEFQQNGYHGIVAHIDRESLIKKKSKDYHLLSYENDGLVINEDIKVIKESSYDENIRTNRTADSDMISDKISKGDSTSLDLDIQSDNENVVDMTKVEEHGDKSEESPLSNIVVTEAHVHNFFSVQNDSKDATASEAKSAASSATSIHGDEGYEIIESTIDIGADWPELEELTRTVGEEDVKVDETSAETLISSAVVISEIQNNPDEVSQTFSAKNSQEQNEEDLANEIKEETVHDSNETVTVKYQRNAKTRTKSESAVSTTESSSTRTLKSILANNGSEPQSTTSTIKSQHNRSQSQDEIQECKTVKFSKDTVFNENKTKKYKMEKVERIHLRDIYRGKISSAAAAKLNPLYREEGEDPEEAGSMTDDEKVAYQEAVKKMLGASNTPGSLNTPAYLEHYLILKAHGMKQSNFDIEQLPAEIERPAYEKLIQRTLAKERRKLIVKWTLVILTVAIITAVATTLGVFLTDR